MSEENGCRTLLRDIWKAVNRNERLTEDEDNIEIIKGCARACNNTIKELINAYAKKKGWIKAKPPTVEEAKENSVRCKDCEF